MTRNQGQKLIRKNRSYITAGLLIKQTQAYENSKEKFYFRVVPVSGKRTQQTLKALTDRYEFQIPDNFA
jgi:hypothetical protein